MGTNEDRGSTPGPRASRKKASRPASTKKTAKKAARKTVKKAAKKSAKKVAKKTAKKASAKRTTKKPATETVAAVSPTMVGDTMPAAADGAGVEAQASSPVTAIAEMVMPQGPQAFSEVDPDPDVDALVESDAVEDAASLMEVEVVETMGAQTVVPLAAPAPVTWVCASPAPKARARRSTGIRKLAIFAFGLLSGWVLALVL